MPYITKIELRGFKSFGNTKVTIPLSKGLTAIIGPNGHGKSNIFDALSFVLGEMSAKTMRAKHLPDLIYWGDSSNGHRPAPFAEVSLHFDNNDGKIPVNSGTVVISRRVNRNGECVYRINNKRASRQDIVDLLAPSMTSPGGYNFVMQGDVSRFVNMNPMERRLVIDDLAGVAEYDDKKQKSMVELQKVENNLKTTNVLLNEISSRMNELKAQMETAMKYKQLTTELDQIRAALVLIKRDTQKKKLTVLKSKIEKLDEEVKSLKNRHQAVLDEIREKEEMIDKLEKLIDEKQSTDVLVDIEKARAQISAFNDLIVITSKRKSEIDKKIAELNERIKKTEGTESQNLPIKIDQIASKFKELHVRFDALSKSLNESTSRETAEEILHQIRTVLDELAGIVDSLSTYLPSLSRQYPEPRQRSNIENLRSELTVLMGTRTELENQLAGLQEKIQLARADLEKADTLGKKTGPTLEKLRADKNRLRDKLHELREKERALAERARGQDENLQDLRIQKRSIETELETLQEEIKKLKTDVKIPPNSNIQTLSKRAEEIELERSSLGEVNFRAIRDFKEEEKKYNEEKLRYDKLTAEQNSLLEFMKSIDEKKKEVFMKTFNEISRHFSEIFSELSPGGVGELVLENKESPFEGGLDIRARPQGKEVSYVGSISGGEKALTALAFIFALQRYRPTTFYVLDEIDAHLDPQNRKKVAEMLHKFSRQSQIVVITLHDAMMSVADRLFGITMENKISRVFSVELSGLGG
jgi:chromosome segregation protein